MDSARAAGLSNSPPYFFLDGNQLAYYNVDDVPHEALEKLALASSFFLECKTVCDFLPYDLCPLKVALQLDNHTRQIVHRNNGHELHKDFFNGDILRTAFAFIRNRQQILPEFLVGGWYNIHEEYLVHPHFHRANIRVASAIKEFITLHTIRTNDSTAPNNNRNTTNSNSNGGVSEQGVADDTQDNAVIDDVRDQVTNDIDDNATVDVGKEVAVNSPVMEQVAVTVGWGRTRTPSSLTVGKSSLMETTSR
jgi:hypothetical protein